MISDRRKRELEEARTRKKEIRALLEGDTEDLDLEALSDELDKIEAHERRAALVDDVISNGRVTRTFGDGGGSFLSTGDDVPELRSFALGDDLAPSVRVERGQSSIAAMVRGMATGDWSHVTPEQRALISTGAAAAIPGASVLGIVEQAMKESVVFRAGAQIVPIDRPTEKVARVVSTGTPEWLPDTADRELTDQTITITPEDLTAYSAWLYTECSIESLEDAKGLDQAIEGAFARQLAGLYDEAACAGNGTDKPLGVCAMTTADNGINELANVGELVDHKPFITAAGQVLGMNHRPTSVMIDTDTWTELAMLTDTTGQPIQPPKAYSDLLELPTNYVSDGNAIVADWSKWLFGTRTNITLEVNRLGDGFKRGFVQIRAYVRFGGIPTDPSAFCRMSGITLQSQSAS